jgi:Putative beta-barrel porin 2
VRAIARSLGWALLVSNALTVGLVPRAFAQDTVPLESLPPARAQENAPAGVNPPPGTQANAGPVLPSGAPGIIPTGEYKPGVPLGGWMLFPSIFVGGVWDSNVAQAAQGTPTTSAFGVRAVPRIFGVYDGGIYKTTVYGIVDGDFYSDGASNTNFFDNNTLSVTAGFSQYYEAMQDLFFNFYGNYTRQRDIFNSAVMFNNGAIGPIANPPSTIPIVVNPFGTTPGVNPIPFNQFALGGSVTKTFGQAFATLGASGFYILYDHSVDNIPVPFQTSLDGGNIWVTGRLGYHIFPWLYVFGEGDGIFQRFNNSLFDTNGYRVIGGLGTDDPNSLIRGEIYGGYWAQTEENATGLVIPLGLGAVPSTNTASGVFGGRLAYYPTPYWAFIASVDEALGVATFISPTVPAGAPALTTTALLQTTYGIAREWSVGARGGYVRAQYFDISLVQNGWLVGGSFNYEIWRNLMLTLDYQYTTMRANVPFDSFVNQQATAGVTWRY